MTARGRVVECEKCGVRYRPIGRKSPHEGSVECLALQVQNAYTKRGWAMVVAQNHIDDFSSAHVPLEMAKGSWYLRSDPVRTVQGAPALRKVLCDVGFVPVSAYKLAMKLVQKKVYRNERIVFLRHLWSETDLLDSLDTISRMKGDIKTFLRKRVEEKTRLTYEGLDSHKRSAFDAPSPFAAVEDDG